MEQTAYSSVLSSATAAQCYALQKFSTCCLTVITTSVGTVTTSKCGSSYMTCTLSHYSVSLPARWNSTDAYYTATRDITDCNITSISACAVWHECHVSPEGIEDCRKCCGGHGYLAASGLPELLGDYLQNCTVEGENHMLTQQTVRHLLKALTVKGSSSSSGGSSSSSVKSDSAYLRWWKQGSKCTAQSERDMQQLPLLHAAFRCLITHLHGAYTTA
eukprot:8894-Heterococcus_DN1.PRE.4